MNRLEGEILEIKEYDGLSLIKTIVSQEVVQIVVISDERDRAFLNIGNRVELNFKETEIILSKNEFQISVENKLKCKIKKIVNGSLLSQVEVDYNGFVLNAVISTTSSQSLGFIIGDDIWIYLKANDILISPC